MQVAQSNSCINRPLKFANRLRPCAARGCRARGSSRAVRVVRCALTTAIATRVNPKVRQAEADVIEALQNAEGRGRYGLDDEQLEQLYSAVEVLERDGGVEEPTLREELDGRWRLLFTSSTDTASPVQRTFVGVKAFSVYQDVELMAEQSRVNNIVDFGPNIGYLKVEAEASTTSRPLPDFTPRQGAGLALFGRSNNYPPARPHMRIDFQFDRAAFHFKFLPITLPYPVPFKILGDERKGWIDVTYTNQDGTLRLSRGNKGTLFILTKDLPLKELLHRAISAGDDKQVLDLIPQLAAESPEEAPAESEAATGTWRLVWSQQAPNASPLQKFGSAQARSFQIIADDGASLRNLVDLGPVSISADAECSASSATRTSVLIQGAQLALGPLRLPLPVPKRGSESNPGFVDWLYLDEDLRITRGSKGSLFVHVREE